MWFLLLPMALPRFMVEYGFVDTVTRYSEAYRVLQPSAFTSQYAAMPSLHVGWNLLMGIAITPNASLWLTRGFGWIMPPVMWRTTVVTANHFLDDVVGAIVALVGLWLAWRRDRRSAFSKREPGC